MLKCKLILFILAFSVLLSACKTPLPDDKSGYVGEWRAPGMSLLITQDGSVAYERFKSGANFSVNGPLAEFEGDRFSVGVGFLTTLFVASTPPYQSENSTWKMVVDGVELTRS